MVNDVGLIGEVNFMQSLLEQQEQKEEPLDIPVTDAVMEATREINMYKACSQLEDVTLSTNPQDSGVVSNMCPTHVSLQGSICHSLWGRVMWKEFFPKTTSPFSCKMMLVINCGLRALNFLYDGDGKLQIPDFIGHERDLENAPLDAESDEEEMKL